MSLWTSMYTGVTGLRSSQNALNITAHNLANVNTEGYVRQQATFRDLSYYTFNVTDVNSWQLGYGVESDTTKRLRDFFLDKSFRAQSGREGFYAAQEETVWEIESVFGELEGQAFQGALDDLKEAMAEIAKTPDGLAQRSGLVMCAEEFINRANAIYNDLIGYQKNLDVKIKDMVDEINGLGETITYLNRMISRFEATNVENANDLRDQRDMALDRLGRLANIKYIENEDGVVTVKLEGIDFVSENTYFKLDTAELDGDKNSTYLSVVWPHLENKEVFYFANDVSTLKGNDIGELKGLLMARGDYVANYTDMPDETADNYDEQLKYYHDNVEYSVIMKTQAMFDQLINGIVSEVNNILSPMKEETMVGPTNYIAEDGTVISFNAGDKVRFLDQEKASYGNDADKTMGTELFSRKDAERYVKATSPTGETVYIYNEKNEFGDDSLYTLGNIEINKRVLDNYAYLPLTNGQGEADFVKAEELYNVWERNFDNINPDNMTKKTFMEYYTAMTGDIANTGYLFTDVVTNQNTVVSNVDDARWSQYGVSSEEELSNMIKFQNAYNANSRYITAVSSMLEHLINNLGA